MLHLTDPRYCTKHLVAWKNFKNTFCIAVTLQFEPLINILYVYWALCQQTLFETLLKNEAVCSILHADFVKYKKTNKIVRLQCDDDDDDDPTLFPIQLG